MGGDGWGDMRGDRLGANGVEMGTPRALPILRCLGGDAMAGMVPSGGG